MSIKSTDKSLLQWNPPPNAPAGCISGYTIQWPGNSVTIRGSVNSVEVSFLIRESNNGLPFCVDVLTTVTPRVCVVPSPLVFSQNDPPVPLVYPDPGLSDCLQVIVTSNTMILPIIFLKPLAIIPMVSLYYQ